MPGAEKHANLAFGRQRAPVTPDARPFVFFVRRLGKSADLNMAGIHPLVEQIDHLTFACTLYTGNQDQRGKFSVLLEIVLCIEQSLPELRLFTLVERLVDAMGKTG